jgi:uncharacterized protein YodC (DUF2158 family)
MSEKRFSLGDVVQLKSGGAKMTAREYDINSPSSVLCAWHDNDGDPQTVWYLEGMLSPAAT